METIRTSFGCLRPWAVTDAQAIVKYGNNRKVWANLRDGFPSPYTPQAAQAFLAKMEQQSPRTFLAIVTPDEAVGGIGISINQDVHRFTAELGYWLGEPFWGRGWMSEAVKLFCEAAFVEFGLNRIYAEPYAVNKGSTRVLEKAGFELEGLMRANVFKDGRVLDQFMYALVKNRD
ncbi:MAG: GNAT family N-acetyltransferase [Anaerolineae bacterium]|nr:GNAT family N-acetyltransferase [Anaerolineae bacterium]